ncbi:MAG: hypothetical protein KY464_15040, partial [Gemmatimonadetes bacterium]|nr:hypothetical protein [Gemmatimonadota bacterium]
ALPFALAGLEIVRRRDGASAALLGAWTVLPVINVLLQGKPWPYLWLPIYAPLAVLTVVGMHGMLAPLLEGRRAEWSGSRPLLLTLAAVLMVSAILPPANWLLDSRSLLRAGPAAATYDAGAFGQHGRGDASLSAIAESIRERTGPGDRVLSWGMTPTVNFLSGRSSPSRFGVDLPLESGGGHPLQRAYRRELMAALHATPPKFVVVDIPECDLPVSDHGIQDFPELAGFLRERYQLETEVGYRREGQPGCVRVLRASNGTATRR